MNKIKSYILVVLALIGLFGGLHTNKAFARTPDVTCNSATIYGNVQPNGTTVTAWFEWGNDRTTVQNGSGIRTGSQTVSSNEEVSADLSGLNQNTNYYYRLAIQTGGYYVPATTESFITTSCQPITPTNPTVTLTATPSSINSGQYSTLTWSSTNATGGCSAPWTQSTATSGSMVVYPTSTTNYSITCSGASGTTPATDSATVVVNTIQPVNNPTVSLTANPTSINSGGTSNLSWRSSNATYCTSSNFNIDNAINNSFGVNVYPTSTTTYSITCYGGTGTTPATDSATVVVNTIQPVNNPTVSLTANPTSINSGSSSNVRWTSSYTNSCAGTNFDTGNATNNSLGVNVYPTVTTTYSITCYGTNGGSVSDSVTVYVNGQQNQIPTVTTNVATNIGDTYATLNGYVSSNGSNQNVNTWFEWSTNQYNFTQTPQTYYGSASNTPISAYVGGLSQNTTYYFRAAAQVNGGQIIYGNIQPFNTTGSNYCYNCYDNNQTSVTTYAATGITDTSATLNGYASSNGIYYNTTTWFQWGTSYGSLYSNTNTTQSYGSSFSQPIYNLTPNTLYYFRAVAENSNGSPTYGNIQSFTTTGSSYYNNNTCNNQYNYNYNSNNYACAPTAITTTATNIDSSSAKLVGLGMSNSSSYYTSNTTAYFEYGTTYSLGTVTPTQNIGNTQSTPFYQNIFNLASDTTYYYRAVVSNQYGTSRGEILSFTTLGLNVPEDNVVYRYKTTTIVTNTAQGSLVSLNINHDGETINKDQALEYTVDYKNTSSKDLKDVVLQIYLPKELDFVGSSRGTFSTQNSTIVADIQNLAPQEEGNVLFTVKVNSDAETGKIIVTTANLSYTVSTTNAQAQVFAYSKNTIGDTNVTQLGALALFGSGFLPNTLLGWLILILLIVLIVLAVRKSYSGHNSMFVGGKVDNDPTIHHS
jgi:hypothetical protein